MESSQSTLERRLGLHHRQPRRSSKVSRLWALLVGLTCCWLLGVLAYTTSWGSATLLLAPLQRGGERTVMLLALTESCTAPLGVFFQTKALQTKAALSRRLGWELWVVGEAELSAAAAAAALAPVSLDESEGRERWPMLVLEILSARLRTDTQARAAATWLVCMQSELLVTHADASSPIDFDAIEAADAHVVLLAAGARRAAGGAALEPGMDLVLVRLSPRALAFFTAVADEVASARGGLALLISRLAASDQWRSAVLVLDRSAGVPARPQQQQGQQQQQQQTGGGAAAASRPILATWHETSSLMPTLGEGGALVAPELPRVAWLTSFGGCSTCHAPASAAGAPGGKGGDGDSALACRTAMMRAFTSFDDRGPLLGLGAQHAAPGSVHVRPAHVGGLAGGGWLQRHRGGLGRCLPSLLVVGSQRSYLGSLHWLLRRGWHRAINLNAGDREVHFFSMDNRYRGGLLAYERRFHPNSSVRGGCARAARAEAAQAAPSEVVAEVSSTYFDYPKAPARVAAILPAARIAILLREPVARALSAFNVRWQTWLCGKLIWSRSDCWNGVVSEDVVRASQVGPFQMHAALKLWRSCASPSSSSSRAAPSIRCLQQDYLSKLRNKTTSELRALTACAAASDAPAVPAATDWAGCLRLTSVMLGPKQIHKVGCPALAPAPAPALALALALALTPTPTPPTR